MNNINSLLCVRALISDAYARARDKIGAVVEKSR